MTTKKISAVMKMASECTSAKEAALTYARAGIPVFPCSKEKKPLTAHGFKDATINEKTIRDAWDACPDAFIALPTGKTTGIVVLDLDKKNGKDGVNALERATKKEEWRETVPTVLTPSGGLHLYFQAPDRKLKSTTDKLGPGIDTRGDGGYIILPPSRSAQGPYTLQHEAPLPAIPQHLEQALLEAGVIVDPQASPPPSIGKGSIQDLDVATALVFLNPDCSYNEWLHIGMALHDHDPEGGLTRWEEWSARGKKHKPAETAEKWKSFGHLSTGARKITIRTLFAFARKYGWVPCQVPAGCRDPLAVKYGEPVICRTTTSCDINQQYLAAYYVQKTGVVFDAATQDLWEYDSEKGLWQRLSDTQHIQQLSEAYQEVLVENGFGHLLASRKTRALQQISTLVRGLAYKDEQFGNRDLVHLANGMLHIMPDGQVELQPFSPDYFSRNRSEIPWDDRAECPAFLAAIGSVLEPDDCRLLQLYFGQCLLGTNLTQRILVLRGPAATMKSTLQRILILLVGEENVATLRPQHLGGRFELFRFIGRTLLVAADVSADFLSSESAHILKSLVGGDAISTERKGVHESATIRGTYNVCVTSNVDLRIRLDGDRAAWERRLALLDFKNVSPKRRMPDFAAHIVGKEGPGILRWAVEGAAAMLRETSVCSNLRLTPVQQERISDLLSQSDSVRTFVDECVDQDPNADISVAELYEAYDDFCGQRGWGAISQRQFECALPHVMKTRHNVVKSHSIQRFFKQVRGFRGVRVIPPGGGPSAGGSTTTASNPGPSQEEV